MGATKFGNLSSLAAAKAPLLSPFSLCYPSTDSSPTSTLSRHSVI
ncbi:hypothetical protein VD0002_g10117 [Verticillium dahliae]|nr:hypothetical protein VD0002_g10117 [Verticillium dahliae]